MKKIITAGILLFAVQCISGQINSKLQAYVKEISYNKQKQPAFITLKDAPQIAEGNVAEFINAMILNGGSNKVAVLKTDKDNYGFSHTRYSIRQNGIPLYNKVIVAHCKNGQLTSLNGDLTAFADPVNQFSLSEKGALQYALKKVNAKKYKWENKAEEAHMREALNKPDFSFYPTGTKVIFEKDGKLYNAFQFTIYAEEPLYRANVFVDASSGKVLGEQSLICNVDVPGTAITKYSGTQTLTCDQNGATYRLRETQRGQGVETYNLNNSSNYVNTDFTNTSTNWSAINNNQAARDAHWGAEKTYDFYNVKFNINSIDNAGYKLLSYVHYNNNYNNAFWDGLRMTYGDGNGAQFTIFTALDVCGHEITHGLVSNTAGLGGSGTDECDALNEGFADIFGTSIERFSRPTNWNWIMGLDITPTSPNGLRNMSNPNVMQQPDTYQGTYWDNGGEPHNNNGPCIFWFYLLVTGGAGTNDNGNAYNVTGLGNVDAEKIAYRALTTYFVPNTDYAMARVAAIQAAKDLFGSCSNQVQQTANAWYAVGVGGPYSNSVIAPNFLASNTSFCALPATVNFDNTTSNGANFTWDFGDGSTDNSANPTHNYLNNGTYTVKLKATGCFNAVDSIIKQAYIVINTPDVPSASGASTCDGGQVGLTATGNAYLAWYSSPGSTVVLGSGTNFTTPNLSSSTTYYVVNSVTYAPVFGGIINGSGGGYLNNSSQSLVFDVLQNSVLNSVVVYAQTAGYRTVELRDALSTILQQTTVNLNLGTNTITLDYYLTPGTNYELGLSSTSASSLYRSNSGVNFPYNIGGCVNITSSTAGNGFYYWFYKWKVSKEACTSPAVPVTAVIIPGPAVTASSPFTSVCSSDVPFDLTGSPAGGNFSGLGVNGTTFDPSMAGTGSVSIVYMYSDNNGCSATDSIAMDVDICTGISSVSLNNSNLSIFPNPFTDRVVIKSGLAGQATANVTDASGRLVVSRALVSPEENVELGSLSKGLYLLNIQDKEGKTLKTLKLVKE